MTFKDSNNGMGQRVVGAAEYIAMNNSMKLSLRRDLSQFEDKVNPSSPCGGSGDGDTKEKQRMESDGGGGGGGGG